MANVAVVTGASSGVGRATAIALASAGWEVTLIARRAEALKKTVEEFKQGFQVQQPETVAAAAAS